MKRKSLNGHPLDNNIILDVAQVSQIYKDLSRKKSFGVENNQQ